MQIFLQLREKYPTEFKSIKIKEKHTATHLKQAFASALGGLKSPVCSDVCTWLFTVLIQVIFADEFDALLNLDNKIVKDVLTFFRSIKNNPHPNLLSFV